MAINSEKLLKIVAGIFNAAPGAAYLPDLEAFPGTELAFAREMVATSIYTESLNGATTPAEIGVVLAGNFGLVADDVAGSPATQAIDFFTNGLTNGVNAGDLVLEAVNFLENPSLAAEFAPTAQLLSNKAAVSAAYSAVKSSTSLDDLQAALEGVTGDAALTEAEIAALVAAAPGTLEGSGSEFALTVNTDVATANTFTSGLAFTPGGDDRINTLQDEDTLTGEGSNPTLNATVGNANDNGATIITPSLNGIETLNATFSGSGGAAVTALDMQDATGLASVNIDRVSQAVNTAEVGNIQDATVNQLSLANTNANQSGVVEFSYAAGVLLGENTVSLGVSNVQVAALNIGQNTSGIAARGVGTQGYENITLDSTGADNTIGTLNIPMDTGTAGVLTITGTSNLTLGASGNAVNIANNALVEVENLYTAGTGIALAGSRISTIDASALEGNFTIVLDNILDVGKAGTSGVNQDVTVTGGMGDDTFVLYDVVQTGDTINGGADGNDTLLFYSGSALNSVALGIDNASMFADGSIGAIAADFANLADVTSVTVRNISSDVDVGFNGAGADNPAVLENEADPATGFTLTNLTDVQATGITIQHATTLNNQIQNTTITAALATNTADDTLGITISDGTNTDPRSNFSVVTAIAGNASTIENITITDSDTESNSVELTNFAQHTGTITLTGGMAGTFLNLDVDTAGADAASNTTGLTLAAGIQQGMMGLDTDGLAVDYAPGIINDFGNLATEVRLGAATINAADEASNVIVRVSTNAASANGAQSITMGTGDDTVIFDLLNDSRAGLTISDTVSGGDGTDELAIDGHGVRVSLGASEWTNVSGFESIRTVGNGAAALGTVLGQNSYNLTLTNELISANGDGMLTINNDNDSSNDAATTLGGSTGANTPGTGAESAITIDARTLSSQNHFNYNGEEGGWADTVVVDGLYTAGEMVLGGTVDKFIFSDANINGGNVIDGGALDNIATTFAANTDVIEVRNGATVTTGDLAGIQNVGIIAGSNDQAVAQTLTLELNDNVVDALVDSYHTSSTSEVETVTVRMNDAADIAAPVAGMALDLDVSTLTAKSGVNATLYANATQAVTDTIQLSPSGGAVVIGNFETTGDAAGVLGTALDKINLSLSKFTLIDAALGGTGLSTVGGGLNAGDFNSSVALVSASTSVIAEEIIFDQTNGNLFYNTDGATAGGLTQIATLTAVTDLALADFTIIG